jgi:hypothetical protein
MVGLHAAKIKHNGHFINFLLQCITKFRPLRRWAFFEKHGNIDRYCGHRGVAATDRLVGLFYPQAIQRLCFLPADCRPVSLWWRHGRPGAHGPGAELGSVPDQYKAITGRVAKADMAAPAGAVEDRLAIVYGQLVVAVAGADHPRGNGGGTAGSDGIFPVAVELCNVFTGDFFCHCW